MFTENKDLTYGVYSGVSEEIEGSNSIIAD